MKRTLCLLVLVGCRPAPPELVYPEPPQWDPLGTDPDFLGDDPYEDGDERLDIGIFYEGGSSEQVAIDDVDNFFYIYESTFSVAVSEDRVEGYLSDAIEPVGNAWWGGGVHWNQARDLSAWNTLHVSLKTSDEEMAGAQLGMTGGGTEGSVTLSDVGLVADGTWQTFEISLQSFADAGVDLSSVTVPLLMLGTEAPAGTALQVDDLYFTVGDDVPPVEGPEFLGDDPFEDGDQRLSIGAFYEGGYSEFLEIDEETRHLYIYDNTFTMGTSEERIEGYISDSIVTGSLPWWGGGVHWDNAEDLSGWDVLHVAFQSTQPELEGATIGMVGGDVEARVTLSSLGFVADGTWQVLEIPLTAFSDQGVDLSSVTVPLLMVQEGNTAGNTLLIDDLYFTTLEG